ncbi:hypothetical protein NQZ68_001933 [Dissostichus eleginoides]|nr:hypothetical protein NQZ68_001933 [Dissostichus eleginoides]
MAGGKWRKCAQIVCRYAPNPSRYEGVNVLVKGLHGGGDPCTSLSVCGCLAWASLSSNPHSIITITPSTATDSYAPSSSPSSSSSSSSTSPAEEAPHRRNKDKTRACGQSSD